MRIEGKLDFLLALGSSLRYFGENGRIKGRRQFLEDRAKEHWSIYDMDTGVMKTYWWSSSG